MFSLSRINKRFQKLYRNHFFKYGLPFMVLLLAGSFGLREFTSIRYEFRRTSLITKDRLEKMGFKKDKEVLQEVFQEYQKVDLDSWENIRGPRPWEEPQTNANPSST